MKGLFAGALALLTLGLVMFISAGCDEESGTIIPPSVDVTGAWGMQQDTETDTHTMTLGQSGSTVTGSVATFVGQTTPIVGFVSGANITMIMSLGTSNTVDFTGIASHNSMSGSWRNSDATEGTWTANRK